MIRRIRLRHWRAFDKLELDLTRPVTFLVAPNGVGKTSLVEAVRFGLLGTRGDRTRGRAVKAGEDLANVELVLALTGGSQVEVIRTLRRSGAVTFVATIDGNEATEDEYLSALTRAWSADPAMLDAVIFGPPTSGKETGFPIKDHLAAVFGIDPLLEAADKVQKRQKALATQIASLRDDLSGTDEAISAAAELVQRLQNESAAADAAQQQAATTAAELQKTANEARAWDNYRSAAASYREQSAALMARLVEASGAPDNGDAQATVDRFRRDAATALDAAVDAANQAELDSARASRASQFLLEVTDLCPTCLRPISEHERDRALAAHGGAETTANDEVSRLRDEADQLRSQLGRISKISQAFAQMRPPVEPTHPDPGAEAVARADAASQEANIRAQAAGAARERVNAAGSDLASVQDAANDQARLADLARQEALLDVTHDSLVKLAGRYLRERVEPLATEIGHRWKVMFGRDGLRLAPDGQLRLERADVDLELADLSSGERATALLVTRLMLASSVTTTTTLWLDEPLEHLDPRRRVGVAQALVRAAQVGTVDQILITTYEETIARRLVATSPDIVGLTNARTADDQLV